MSPACRECGRRSRGRFCARCGAHLGADAGPRPGRRDDRRSWPSHHRGALVGLAGLLGGTGIALLLTGWPGEQGGFETADGAGTVDVPATFGTQDRLTGDAPVDVRPEVGTTPALRCLDDRDCVHWRLPLPEGAQHRMDVTAEGLVIAASATGDANPVVAVDERGVVQWEREDVDDRFANPKIGRIDLAVTEGLVLVRPPGEIVAGFDDHHGRQLFKHRIGDLEDAELTAAERHGEVVVLAFDDGADADAPASLVALDAEDGQRRWHHHGQVAAVGAGMVTLLADGALHRVDPVTGDAQWARPAEVDAAAARLVHLDDDRLLLSASTRGPARLIDGDGRQLVEIDGRTPTMLGPASLVLAVAADRDHLAALDRDGQTRWTTSLTNDGGRPQVLVTDAAILLVSPSGDGYRILDPTTGDARAQGQIEQPGRITGLLGTSTLLVRPGEHRDTATAVGTGDGRARWQAEGARLLAGLLDDAVLVVLDDELLAVALDEP